MDFAFTAQAATFLERPNRFRVMARLHDTEQIVAVHCPNPGRLAELLIPGATIYVSRAASTTRKTTHDLRFVEHPEHGQLVSLDTRLPNALFAEGLRNGFFAPFSGCVEVQSEVTLPDIHAGVQSRIDFRLVDSDGVPCWVEVKSVTLVEKGCARFPDAPTTRGRRHVNELAERVALGERAAVAFIVQRPDATALRPQWETDPAFAQALADADAAGVELYAYTCTLSTRAIHLQQQIPVVLSTDQG